MSAACASASRAAAHGVRAPIQFSYIPYRVPYGLGLKLQEHLVERRANARAALRAAQVPAHGGEASLPLQLKEAQRVARTDILLLLEHTPTYTLGKRDDVAVSGAMASALKADIFQTQRGGLLTYHGPGQLVGYPILDIGAMQLSTRCYIARLQESLRAALAASPLSMSTQESPQDDAKYTGVWVDATHKIASLGVHVRHRVTSHGFALNVHNTALQGFQNIVACGLPNVQLTSIDQQLERAGRRLDVRVPDVARLCADHLATALQRTTEPAAETCLSYIPTTNDAGEQVLSKVLVEGTEVTA